MSMASAGPALEEQSPIIGPAGEGVEGDGQAAGGQDRRQESIGPLEADHDSPIFDGGFDDERPLGSPGRQVPGQIGTGCDAQATGLDPSARCGAEEGERSAAGVADPQADPGPAGHLGGRRLDVDVRRWEQLDGRAALDGARQADLERHAGFEGELQFECLRHRDA